MPTPDVGLQGSRAGKRLTLRTTALVAFVLLAACSDEFSPPPEQCAPPSCEGQPDTCFAWDFAGPECPSDWDFAGDPIGNVVAECTDGKLHVVALNTLDLTASTSLPTPMVAYEIHLAARMAVELWDYDTLLTATVNNVPAFIVNASANQTSPATFSLCASADDCSATFEAARGEEHLFQFVITDTGTTASVDCQPWGSTPAVELARDSSMSLAFGHAQANPIDGTIDDVVISFP